MELDAMNGIRNCSPWVGGGALRLHSAQTPEIMSKNKTHVSVSDDARTNLMTN